MDEYLFGDDMLANLPLHLLHSGGDGSQFGRAHRLVQNLPAVPVDTHGNRDNSSSTWSDVTGRGE